MPFSPPKVPDRVDRSEPPLSQPFVADFEAESFVDALSFRVSPFGQTDCFARGFSNCHCRFQAVCFALA